MAEMTEQERMNEIARLLRHSARILEDLERRLYERRAQERLKRAA